MATQQELNKQSQRRRKKLGYARFTRVMPIAYVAEIDAFIKKKGKEWDGVRSCL